MADKYLSKTGLQYYHNKIKNVFANKSEIPTVNNSTISIRRNGVALGDFTTNSATGRILNVIVPTKTSDLTNDVPFAEKAEFDEVEKSVTLSNNVETTMKSFTVGKSGILVGSAFASFVPNATGRRGVSIRIKPASGSAYYVSRTNGVTVNGANKRITVPIVTEVNAGDEVGVMLYQNSGGNLSVTIRYSYVIL